jgi:hypothetical protein
MIPKPPGQKCQHEVPVIRTRWEVKKFEARGWDVTKCSNGASVLIDGVGYCRHHAGSVALKKLENAGRVVDA